MEIKLRQEEGLRLYNSPGDVFVDSAHHVISSEEDWKECLVVSFYDMHKVFVLRKERFYKMFLFKKEDAVRMEDFGYYADGEIVFTNSKTNQP